MGQGVTVDFNANIARFTSAIDKATNDLNRFQGNASRISGNLNKVFGTLGVGLSAAGFAAIIKGSIDAADKLGDLSKSTGIAVEQLAGLKLASEQSGAELEGVAASINKLSVNIGKDADKFARLGITAKEPLEAFKQLADVFVAIKDPQQRAAFAAEALGKSWQTAAPLLSEGGEAIGRMVDKGTRLSGMTQKMVEDADRFNDSMAELKTSTDGLVNALVSTMLPGLNNTADAMRDLAEKGHPVLVLWRGLMGMGQVPWDLLMPPDNLAESLKSANRIKELKSELAGIENRLKETGGHGGLVGRWMHGTREEQLQQAAILKNQIATIERHAAELDKPPSAKPAAKPPAGLAGFIGDPDAEARAREEEKRYKEHLAFFEERRKGESQAAKDDYQQIQRWNDLADPAAKYRNEIEDIKFSMSEMGGVSREVGEANIALLQKQIDETDKSTVAMRKAWERFSENVQSNLGDVLYNNLNGRFQDIGEVFKQMLLRMAADAAAEQITLSLFGAGTPFANLFGGSKVPAGGGYAPSGGRSFDGGGFTGFGSRSGGIDGKGGFQAILHPNETVIDHAKGQKTGGIVINNNPIYNVDSRSDRAAVVQDMMKISQQSNAELVDKLQRAGAL